MKILIGADPEFFLKNPNSGQFVSAHGILPGTKYEPYKVPHGAVQVDGMAAEFNIDPAEDADAFISNVGHVLKWMKDYIPGYDFAYDPVAVFDQSYFDGQPEVAKELGCDPDYNAWTGVRNDPPPMDQPMRTASGHIHIGWTEGADAFSDEHVADCRTVIRQLDYYLGVHSLLWDGDNRRRSMYGKAGAFRPKPYGCEYRVLSNAWLRSPLLMRWIDNTTRKAMADLQAGRIVHTVYGDTARTIIDSNDIGWQDHYQLELGVPLPPQLKAA